MVLTKRDSEFFLKLRDYGLLTTRQVAVMHFCGIALTTVLRRLRKLEAAFYVQRITGIEAHEVAWALTPKGAKSAGVETYKRHFRRDCLDHDLKLTALRLRLEGLGIAQSWIPEHVIRSQVARRCGLRDMKHRIVPDGLMGVDVSGVKESVAVELELTSKNFRRYHHMFKDYGSKQNIAGVWYVVSSASLGRSLSKAWNEATRFAGTKVSFQWSDYSEVMTDAMTARVHGHKNEVTLSELWRIKTGAQIHESANRPAQPPALAVSRHTSKKIEIGNDVTVENENQNFAPAC